MWVFFFWKGGGGDAISLGWKAGVTNEYDYPIVSTFREIKYGQRSGQRKTSVIMEKGPHKTHCLSTFVQISYFVVCNLFKLCGPCFPRGWFVCNNGKAFS